MSNLLPISVHVLTRNSGATLERCLQSVACCREILVIDGGSTDATLDIARTFNAAVLEQGERGPCTDFAAVRNIGLSHTKQPWVLALDSDEWASEELISDLQILIEGVDRNSEFETRDSESRISNRDAYYVPRKYVLPDQRLVTHASSYPNERIYFFKKDAALRWVKPVHERVELKPSTHIGHVRGWTCAPIGTPEEFWKKNERYLQIETGRDVGKGWSHWIAKRLFPTLRSRLVIALRLAWIWLLPHRKAIRLPLRYERLRWQYGWALLRATAPVRR